MRTGTLKALIFGIYSKVYFIYGISKSCERTKINNTPGQTIPNFYNSLYWTMDDWTVTEESLRRT